MNDARIFVFSHITNLRSSIVHPFVWHHNLKSFVNQLKRLIATFKTFVLLPNIALLKVTLHSTGFSTKSAVRVARAGSTMKGTRNIRTEKPEMAIREKEKVA